jgi:hypothetical protein
VGLTGTIRPRPLEHMFVANLPAASDFEGVRRCVRRQLHKPVEQFAWRRKPRGQLDTYCRPCRADYKQMHYAASRERYIANAARRKQSLAEERTKFLIEYFATHPCVEFAEADPLVLEFNHLGDKSFTIGAQLRYRDWETLLREIAKCEVVCANCHRRTAIRRGSVRALLCGHLPETRPQERPQTGNALNRERATGLEPALEPWKGPVQPLTPRPRGRLMVPAPGATPPSP